MTGTTINHFQHAISTSATATEKGPMLHFPHWWLLHIHLVDCCFSFGFVLCSHTHHVICSVQFGDPCHHCWRLIAVFQFFFFLLVFCFLPLAPLGTDAIIACSVQPGTNADQKLIVVPFAFCFAGTDAIVACVALLLLLLLSLPPLLHLSPLLLMLLLPLLVLDYRCFFILALCLVAVAALQHCQWYHHLHHIAGCHCCCHFCCYQLIFLFKNID